ncbi:hypothetical protein G6F43_005663 [Rhizopus delemar]|nr:hypothetical protein G6F43_005663 [Rhizopus delemar]
MSQGWVFNSAKAENIAAHYVTSLNVFIHNNPKVDDFADQSKIAYQIELLATGGFWGDLKSCTMKVNPFLGSSISGPPETLTGSVANPFSREIFVIKPDSNKTASVRSNRTINQYVKEHSVNLWAFHNKYHHDNGFFPTNPLCIQSSNMYYEAGSLLLKIYAERKMQIKRLNELLQQTSNKRNNAPKNAKFKAIVVLLKFTKQRYAFIKNICLNNQEVLTKRKELINIYNSVLNNAIKSMNMAKVRKAEEMFSPKKLNIFDEEDNEEDDITSND